MDQKCPFCDKAGLSRLDRHIRMAHKGEYTAKKRLALPAPKSGGTEPKVQKCTPQPPVEKFQPITIVRNIDDEKKEILYPTKTGSDGNIGFNYKGTDRWIDLTPLMLALKFKVTKKNGANIPAEPKVTPIQAIHSTMWKNSEMSFNREPIMATNNYQGYGKYINTLLYHEKSSLLSGIGYGTEAQRKAMIKNSREVNLYGPLPLDTGSIQTRYLLPLVDFQIQLYGQDVDFLLIRDNGDTDDYTLEVMEARLLYKSMTFAPEKAQQIENQLDVQNANYPLTRQRLENCNLPKGTLSFQQPIVTGQVPKNIFVAFIETKSMQGDITKDPFKFAVPKLRKIAIHRGGSTSTSYKLDDDLLRSFVDLMNMTYERNGVTFKDFKESSRIFGFKLSTEENVPFQEQGNVTLELDFEVATTENISVVLLLEYDNNFQISKERAIFKDYLY